MFILLGLTRADFGFKPCEDGPLIPAVAAEITFLYAPSSFIENRRFTRPRRSFTGGPSSLCCRVFAVQCLQLGRAECSRFTRPRRSFAGGPSSLCCRVFAVQCLQLGRAECSRFTIPRSSFTGGPSSLCCRVFAAQCLQLGRVQGKRATAIYEGHA